MNTDRFYWLHWMRVNDDQSITVKTTGYDDDSSHWIDYVTIMPSDADYLFWQWMRETQESRLMTQLDLDLLKASYQERLK